ncbi:MAG: hypothetical protein K9G65_04730, partial [Rickettsiaceae bacterium]|nr:hypothetical protein [Rickettsiaceae bacterium]
MIPIIFGISGTKLTQEELDLFKVHQVAGFILFSRNVESRGQVIELTNMLKGLYSEREVPVF